jgi:hypothetical protein
VYGSRPPGIGKLGLHLGQFGLQGLYLRQEGGRPGDSQGSARRAHVVEVDLHAGTAIVTDGPLQALALGDRPCDSSMCVPHAAGERVERHDWPGIVTDRLTERCAGRGEGSSLPSMADAAGRFRPLWRAEKIAGGYVVRDLTGQALAYPYSRENEAEARQAKVLTADEARRIARSIARLPELVAKERGLACASSRCVSEAPGREGEFALPLLISEHQTTILVYIDGGRVQHKSVFDDL